MCVTITPGTEAQPSTKAVAILLPQVVPTMIDDGQAVINEPLVERDTGKPAQLHGVNTPMWRAYVIGPPHRPSRHGKI